jgi:hypothetical protein
MVSFKTEIMCFGRSRIHTEIGKKSKRTTVIIMKSLLTTKIKKATVIVMIKMMSKKIMMLLKMIIKKSKECQGYTHMTHMLLLRQMTRITSRNSK